MSPEEREGRPPQDTSAFTGMAHSDPSQRLHSPPSQKPTWSREERGQGRRGRRQALAGSSPGGIGSAKSPGTETDDGKKQGMGRRRKERKKEGRKTDGFKEKGYCTAMQHDETNRTRMG